jgi:hypothetical protein
MEMNKMNETITLETNENGHAMHDIYVNGVRMSIFQHGSGRVSMMIHTDKKADLKIDICNVKVTKKTTWVGETRWADIQVIENTVVE